MTGEDHSVSNSHVRTAQPETIMGLKTLQGAPPLSHLWLPQLLFQRLYIPTLLNNSEPHCLQLRPWSGPQPKAIGAAWRDSCFSTKSPHL